MVKKIKENINKKYTTIAVYIIGTAVIILIMALAIINLHDIYKCVLGIFHYILKILMPIIIGISIAYIIDPLVGWIEDKYRKIRFLKFKKPKKYRMFAVATAIIVIIFTIVFLITLFIFSITKQISDINFDDGVKIVKNYVDSFSYSLNGVEDKLSSLNIESSKISEYISKTASSLGSSIQDFVNNFITSTVSISGTVVNFIIGIIISIYILIDKDYFIMQRKRIVKAFVKENTAIKIGDLWRDFDTIFSGFVRGQLLDVLFMGVSTSIVLSIIGIKYSVLIGSLAGVCHMIPYFGPVMAYIGTISFGLLNGQPKQVVIAIISLIVVQQIDANIVAPKLLGNSVSLKPVFILIAVLLGGSIGGILGMVLAVPCAAFLKLLFSRFIENKIAKKESVEKDEIE
ncbi:MAG: AI-2E family transporter [Bacillota bacterium]|nr:AI-2E family transporter [Bacillota bacterium]